MHTQLTSAIGYNPDRMIFSDPVKGSIPNTNPEIKFQRIYINTKNEDGTVGELIVPTHQCFSFGVSENTDPKTGEVTGYVFPLCLWSRTGPTSEEKEWVKTFDSIVEHCKDYLLDHKEDIDQYELERSDLRRLNCLYYKKEKGKVVPGTGPTLYAKLMVDRKSKQISSMFYDTNDVEVDPMTLLGKRCNARVAMKFESIFIGSKITIQIKLYEASVEVINNERKRFFGNRIVAPRRPAPVKVDSPPSINSNATEMVDESVTQEKKLDGDGDSDSEDTDYIGSDSDSDSDSDTKAPILSTAPSPKKKVVKKVTKKSPKKRGRKSAKK